MSNAQKNATDKRENVRAKLNLRVAYGTSFDVHTTAYMQNIGHGGVFIRTENPLEIGARLELEFTLPDSFRTIKAQAQVAWARKDHDGDLFPAGMGLMFTDILPTDRDDLNSYVRQLAHTQGES